MLTFIDIPWLSDGKRRCGMYYGFLTKVYDLVDDVSLICLEEYCLIPLTVSWSS